MKDELIRLQNMVNDALAECFNQRCEQSELLEVMRYSLLAGGKRIRPVLLLAFCRLCGGSEEDALSAACGVEMLHTYSLIHDDLPCMDDDDLRRGRPTCHKVYGESNAVLAGDALQAAAFSYVLASPVPADRLAAMAASLAEAAGEQGMCGGQYLDTCKDNSSVEESTLYLIHSLKTGALLRAACVMGVQCAGGSEEQLRAAAEFAMHLGLAFQIRDDVLDEISTTEELGKPVGSDMENQKCTYVSVLGLEKAQEYADELTENAKKALAVFGGDADFLLNLADSLLNRKK